MEGARKGHTFEFGELVDFGLGDEARSWKQLAETIAYLADVLEDASTIADSARGDYQSETLADDEQSEEEFPAVEAKSPEAKSPEAKSPDAAPDGEADADAEATPAAEGEPSAEGEKAEGGEPEAPAAPPSDPSAPASPDSASPGRRKGRRASAERASAEDMSPERTSSKSPERDDHRRRSAAPEELARSVARWQAATDEEAAQLAGVLAAS